MNDKFGCSKGTLLLTRQSLQPVEVVRPGDVTWTPRGWGTVVDLVSAGAQPMRAFTTRHGYTLEVVEGQPVVVRRGTRLTTLPASNVQLGDSLILIRGAGCPDAVEQPLKPVEHRWSGHARQIKQPTMLSRGLCRLSGVITGNGYFSIQPKAKGGSLVIDVHADLERILDQIEEVVRNEFGLEVHRRAYKNTPAIRASINSVHVAEWFAENELSKHGAGTATIPKPVRRSPDVHLADYFAGLYDTDGWRGKTGGVGFASVSPTLARATQMELLRLGMVMSRQMRLPANPRHQPAWYVVTCGRSSQLEYHSRIGRHTIRPLRPLPRSDHIRTPWIGRELGIAPKQFNFVPDPPRPMSVSAVERLASSYQPAWKDLVLFVDEPVVEVGRGGVTETFQVSTVDNAGFWADGFWVGGGDPYDGLPVSIQPYVSRRRHRPGLRQA